MESKTVYLTVRVDIEYDEEVCTNINELVDDIISECDYEFTFDNDSAKIVSTEICGKNDESF